MTTVDARLARTPEQWTAGPKGMKLGARLGLLYVFPDEGARTFSTRDVAFPVDFLLINKHGRIVHVFEDAEGDRAHGVPHSIMAALEVEGGFCRENGVKVGDFIGSSEIDFAPKAAPLPKEKARSRVEAKLRENIARHPKNPDVYEALALFYAASGKSEAAVKLFERLLEMGTTAPRLNGLGAALVHAGRPEKAARHFQDAIALDPLLLSAYGGLIRTQRFQGLDEVVSLLAKAVDEHPEFIDGRVALTRLHLAIGDPQSAMRSLENSENTPEILRVLGDTHLRMGDFAKAAESYLKYLEQRPYDPHSRDLRVFIMVHKVKREQERR